MGTAGASNRRSAGAKGDGGPLRSERIARKRDKKMQAILRVTGEVLGEKGYEGTSLESIAERVDLAKASLYHYYPSKEALLTACLDNVAADATFRFSNILEEYADSPATERLRRLIHEHLRIILTDYPHLSDLFARQLDWPARYLEQVKMMREGHDRFFRDVIEEGIQTGEFSCRDARVTRRCIYGAVNSVPVWFRSRRQSDLDELCEDVAHALLKMLRAETATPGAAAEEPGTGASRVRAGTES